MALEPQTSNGSIYGQRLGDRQIRLLKILPAGPNSTVRMQMIEASLDEPNLVYYALSYTWGDPARRVEVDCNGRTICITQNLYEAIWQLRENSFEQFLWADAVCINQEDLLEKTAQVRMMRQIFAGATSVFVWLGKEADSDKLSLQLLHQLSRLVADPTIDPPSSILDLPSLGLPPLFVGRNANANANDQWSALARFMERPWFGRLWTTPEYVVAQDILFLLGPLKIDSEIILHLGIVLFQSPVIKYCIDAAAAPGTASVTRLTVMRQDFRSANHLEFIIALFSVINTDCTYPVDKVFGIAGLVTSIPDTFVDYTKDIDQVLLDTAILCLDRPSRTDNDRLVILSACDPLDRSHNLPSWVPSWKKRTIPARLLPDTKWIAKIKRNDTSFSPVVNEDHSLRCCGKLIDKISCIIRSGPPSSSKHEGGHVSVRKYMKNFLSWLEEVDTMFSRRSDANPAADLEERLWRLLCFDSDPQGGKAGQAEHDGYLVFRSWIRDWSLILNSSVSPELQAESSKVEATEAQARIDAKTHVEGMASFTQGLDANGLGRQICLTEKGYGGWVNQAAEVGDNIAVLYGTVTPFVLRQCGPNSWSLKGECFVEGVMDVDLEELNCADTDIVIV